MDIKPGHIGKAYRNDHKKQFYPIAKQVYALR
jgi:hypothetical protein